MKITYVAIDVLLCLCLISSQAIARASIRRPNPDDVNENELKNRFSAEMNHYGKYTN